MCGHERTQMLTADFFPEPTVFFFCVTSAKWVCKEEEKASNENQWARVSGNPDVAFLYTTGSNISFGKWSAGLLWSLNYLSHKSFIRNGLSHQVLCANPCWYLSLLIYSPATRSGSVRAITQCRVLTPLTPRWTPNQISYTLCLATP